ncbi:MAG: hypothetical protein HZB91_14570 [Elusimicrobia bacterium]|nr:hypothetical protein [Elusimicrobiota bacterium]
MSGIVIDFRSIAPPNDAVRADIKFTPALLGKVAGCLVILTMGLYYLYSGRENQSVSRMLLGAGLILAAFLLFF